MASTEIIEEVFHGHLTTEQVERVLAAIRDGDINIQVLKLRAQGEGNSDSEDDTGVNPDLMSKAYEFMFAPSFRAFKSLETNATYRAFKSIETNATYRHHLTMEDLEAEIAYISVSDIKVKSIKLETQDMSKMDPDLLADAFSKVETVNTIGDVMNVRQAEAVFAIIRDGDIKLKALKVEMNNLAEVNADLMAAAFCRLESVELGGGLEGVIRVKQQETILAAIRDGDGTLKRLAWPGIYMEHVNPDLMVAAFAKLESVNVNGSSVITKQAESIFTAIRDDDVMLKSLQLNESNFRGIEPGLVAAALGKLETVSLGFMGYEGFNDHLAALLTTIRDEDVRLKSLDIGNNELNELEDCHPDLVASAVCRLETVSMVGSRLNYCHVVAILTAIANDDNIKLKNIDLGKSEFKEVNPDLLAALASKLETVCLLGAELAKEQVMAILGAINDDSKLKNLDLTWVDLTEVEPKQIANAVTKLERLELTGAKMTVEQVNMLLGQIVLETSLKSLKIDNVDGVDQELVTEAKVIVRGLDFSFIDLDSLY